MSENTILVCLAGYAFLVVLFIAEGLYSVSGWLWERWKGILGIAMVLFLAGSARADTLLTLTGTDITLGGDTLNFSIPFDLTKMKELHGAEFSFQSGFEGNLRFDASVSTADLWNFYDKAGDHLQIGESDYFRTAYPGFSFPDLGVYPARLVNFECFTCSAKGFSLGEFGSVTITDPPDVSTPEPSATILLACAVALYLFALCLPKRSRRP